jgi:hypothetical protein
MHKSYFDINNGLRLNSDNKMKDTKHFAIMLFTPGRGYNHMHVQSNHQMIIIYNNIIYHYYMACINEQ